MQQLIGVKTNWKGTESVEAALGLIDYGVILRWRDMRHIKKNFTDAENEQVIRHFAKIICERAESRLSAEIAIESLLIWLSTTVNEPYLDAFIDQFFEEPGCVEACKSLVEISLTSETSEQAHDEEIFAMAVGLICKVGHTIRAYERVYPGEFPDAKGILKHISTYLLSVSNSNNPRIRLNLMQYFGQVVINENELASYNRIMSRFGHTVLDHLFSMLFNKKTEAVALQFILQNLPPILEADNHCQKILHETLKYYMLKNPERFTLFLQVFSDEMNGDLYEGRETRNVFLRHLGALLNIASEVNHKMLGREILLATLKINAPEVREDLIKQILASAKIRPNFRMLLEKMRGAKNAVDVANSISQFRSNKRGRKPSFAKAEDQGILAQVSFLGGQEAAKAS